MNNFDIKEFQKDLKEGMSLTDALEKHELTFKEAFTRCNEIMCGKTNGRYHNIYLRKNGKFIVEKCIKGRKHTIGVFEDLDDAVEARDYADKHGWDTALKKFKGENYWEE